MCTLRYLFITSDCKLCRYYLTGKLRTLPNTCQDCPSTSSCQEGGDCIGVKQSLLTKTYMINCVIDMATLSIHGALTTLYLGTTRIQTTHLVSPYLHQLLQGQRAGCMTQGIHVWCGSNSSVYPHEQHAAPGIHMVMEALRGRPAPRQCHASICCMHRR